MTRRLTLKGKSSPLYKYLNVYQLCFASFLLYTQTSTYSLNNCHLFQTLLLSRFIVDDVHNFDFFFSAYLFRHFSQVQQNWLPFTVGFPYHSASSEENKSVLSVPHGAHTNKHERTIPVRARCRSAHQNPTPARKVYVIYVLSRWWLPNRFL